MSTSRIGAVIDALVSTWTTAGLTVNDGPPLQAANTGTDVVYVGWDGGEDNNDAATGTQQWAGLGNRARDEALSVTCYAEATRGETVMKPTRDAALALVATCETSLRTDPQLGGALTPPGLAWFAEVQRLAQPQTGKGSRCGVVFTVNATARL